MKSGMRITSDLSKWLLLTLVLTLVPAALASNLWYVDGVNGVDSNDCLSSQTACQTIGHAISLCSSGDSIMVAPAIYTENLTIGISLKLIGSGAKTTIIDGNQAGTVVTISGATANVRLAKLTIRNGSADAGGGIYNSGTLAISNSFITGNSALNDGGGIWNGATLVIKNSTISGNNGNAFGGSGGIFNSFGGLTVIKSTFRGNSGGTGALSNWGGTATISNSTISENSSYYYGGIFTNGGWLAINNSTISGNSARGITSQSLTSLQNNIVAGHVLGNCFAYALTSKGYNLSDDSSCNFTGPGDMNNTDPVLGKFGNHGGPTQTIPLLPGSPAIDSGNPNGCADDKGKLLKTDQRGWARPGKYDTGGCDMGAFERQHD